MIEGQYALLGAAFVFAAAMFSRQAGIKMLHVPYKGNAPAVIALVGGQP